MADACYEPIPLSADYVPGGTYAAEICVLRYALERNARNKPNEIFAAFEGGGRWTFAQTLELVASLAGNLHELGVRQGDHVVLVLPNSPLALRVMFAINYLGAVYVPINPSLKGSALEHVLHNAGAKLAIIHDSVLDRVLAAAPATLETIVLSTDQVQHSSGRTVMHGVSALTKPSSPPPPPERPIEPFDTQSIIYTSGTTGRSKGVLSSYMHAYSCVGPDAWNCLRSDDRQLVHMPIFHIGGAFIATVSLCVGSSIAVVSHFRTEAFWDQVRELEVTSAFLLGAMATFLLKQPPSPRDRDHKLRMVFIVPLGQSGPPFRERFGVDYYTLFNMTEICTPLISRANPAKDNVCGRPREGVEVRLVDEHDCAVKDGEVGQLILRTEAPWALNHGYNNNPQATADAWRNGWFHTGDAFVRDSDGDYRFVDRLKDAIRRRGENISSYEIEVELLSHPAVREAAAIPVPSEVSEDEVLVVLAPAAGSSIEPSEIINHLMPRMAHHMIPRFVRVMEELPKTPTAKVEKHVLRAQGVTDDTWDRERAGIAVRREKL
ncbi:MAG: AMP-binding protein [Bradyrhizobium sp.]|uniref:AMP-binding protein n=1 Tax=Bradyrhizobium sp. TaxID=376 RepID=UPI0025B89EC3|nr:AMP-binding protein [Bradyrhizobium sp.]MBI5261827.1 AMP-binding protein [Bradyrhizobium sp.]